MSRFDVSVTGFRINAGQRPAAAIARALELDLETASQLVRRFPVLVRQGVSMDEARRLERALLECGALVKLTPTPEPQAEPPKVARSAQTAPTVLGVPELPGKSAVNTWREFRDDTPLPQAFAAPVVAAQDAGSFTPEPAQLPPIDPFTAELRIPSLEAPAARPIQRPASQRPLPSGTPDLLSDDFDLGSRLDEHGRPPSVPPAPETLARTTPFGADLELPWVGPRATPASRKQSSPPSQPAPSTRGASGELELEFDPHAGKRR